VHNLTIDAKGRLKIPTRHQTQINEICEGKMVLSIHPDTVTITTKGLKLLICACCAPISANTLSEVVDKSPAIIN
jgi:hypothetical protein